MTSMQLSTSVSIHVYICYNMKFQYNSFSKNMKTIIIVLKEEYKQDRNAQVLVIKEVFNYVCAKSRQMCDCSSRTFKFYIITT